jgi:hypothetical protein
MRGTILAGVVAALAVLFASPAFGATTVKPWDGSNPFNCTMQYAGQGTTFQHPDADPFCVDYDKTHQDVSQLGLVTFLTKEPARVAAAVNKCWYFQQDHWTGQIIAGDGSTETYHFDGHYFFDKRWGSGGVQVENFTINHRTADPSQLPGFPASWKPYFGPGRGGVEFLGQVKADPNCQPGKGSGPSPYKTGSQGNVVRPGPGSGGAAGGSRLRAPRCGLSGSARHGLGKAHLGQTRARVLKALRMPARRAHGFLHFCNLAVHFGKSGEADFIASVSKAFHSGRVRVGARLRAARASLHGERVLAHRGSAYVLFVNHRGWRLLVGAEHGKVTFLAAVARRLTVRQLARLLVASGS